MAPPPRRMSKGPTLPMTTAFRAAIIIPHYNDVGRLRTCLDALMPLPEEVECVVIDNGSTEDLSPVRARHKDLRIVTESLKGAALARNRGVVETSAPLLFFLDSDCIPAADWVETALRLAETDDIIGGRITVFDETPPPRTGAQGFEAVFAFDNESYVRDKGFSVTANLLTRRDVFDKVGPFRAGLSEDLDWCHRARDAGFGIRYAPELSVAHPSRGDWSALKRKWRRLTEEGFALLERGLRGRLIWAGKALAMPLSALAHTPRVLGSTALDGWGERLRTLGTLYRLRLLRGAWMLKQACGQRL